MRFDPDVHHRQSIRLREYDYAAEGAYFVTICVHQRECLLGQVMDGVMVLNPAGEAVRVVWEGLPARFTKVALDAFVLMPNHFHGVIIIEGSRPATDRGAMNCAPTPPVGARFIAPGFPGASNHRLTLGEIVRTFKAASTRMIRRDLMPEFSWQRNYYERIIRDDELDRVRRYIGENPLRWDLDAENPTNMP